MDDTVFDDAAGWIALPELLTPDRAAALAERCRDALAGLGTELRTGDKPASGTRRLVDVVERVPEAAALAGDRRLLACVEHLLGPSFRLTGVTYRCPQPGFGGQRLHADDLPLRVPGPARVATAVIGLVDFTATNGATRVVPGSHRRPDLQRHSVRNEHHLGARVLTGPAGTAFVFSGHLLHSGTTNESTAPRPALQLNWRRVAQAAA